MSEPISIDDLSHDEICAWLGRALHAQESLPRLTPDESPYLGILRLEKTLKPAVRDSLRDGCLQLLREFCANGRGEAAYVEELLWLASAFKNPEAAQMLAELSLRFPEMPHVPVDIRLSVLGALVDTPPPQPPAFWDDILEQDSERHAGPALSGMLATHPARAVAMMPRFPDTERMGQAAALKLDLTWDDLTPRERHQFVQDVERILAQCGSHFAGPVKAWTESKEGPEAKRERLSVLLARRLPSLEQHVVLRFRTSPDRAEDLVQGFIADMVLEQDLIGRAEQTRGKFRSFLLTALDSYVTSTFRREQAKKRSPGDMVLKMAEHEDSLAARPCNAFDVAWTREVLAETARQMERQCMASQRADVWGIFECRVLNPILDQAEPPSYDELARRFGFRSPSQGMNLLAAAKRMFARVLATVIAEYVKDEDDIELQIAELSAILARVAAA